MHAPYFADGFYFDALINTKYNVLPNQLRNKIPNYQQ